MSDPTNEPAPHDLAELRAEIRRLGIRLSNTEHAVRNVADSLDGIETQLMLALENAAAPEEIPLRQSAPAESGRMDIDVLTEWVDANIGRWAQRKLARHPGQAGFLWCTHWRKHPEAITLLWVLRRAWLDRVNQPGPVMLEYFLHYFYPTLTTLTDPLGPFHACAGSQHTNSMTLLPQQNRQ